MASDDGFTCHSDRSQRTPVWENPTAGLHSTNCGCSQVTHVRYKPEGIKSGGTWWRVFRVQPTHTVSMHTHMHTFKYTSLKWRDSLWINFSFVRIQGIQNFSLLQCFFLWTQLLPNSPMRLLHIRSHSLHYQLAVPAVGWGVAAFTAACFSLLWSIRNCWCLGVPAHTVFPHSILSFVDFSQDLEKITQIYLHSVLIPKLLMTQFTLIHLQLAT